MTVCDMGSKNQTTVEVMTIIRDLVLQGFNQSQIYRHLESIHQQNPAALGPEGILQSKKTIERRVRELQPPDPSGPWKFLDAPLDEQRLVPAVLSHVFYSTQGRVWLSKEHAELVTVIRQSCPDIPLEWAYRYARIFQIAKNDQGLASLATLTFGKRPWEAMEDDGWENYDRWNETAIEYVSWNAHAETYGVHDERSYKKSLENVLEQTIDTPAPPRARRLVPK